MMKVLLVQLPPPRFDFRRIPINIPLAAGFIAAGMARHPELQIQIAGSNIVDLYAETGILNHILELQPNIVGFSLYVWNVQRSLFIASQLRKILPHIKIIIGGPEVTRDNEWVLRHPAVDGGIFGEGECGFYQLVLNVINSQRETFPGSFIKSKGSIFASSGKCDPVDLGQAVYPYLDGVLKPSLDGTLFLETVRGCPYHCRYCYYHKNFTRIRSHSPHNIDKLLDFAYSPDSGIREIYLMDPTFNSTPHYRKVLKNIAKRSVFKDIKLHAELRPDTLGKEDIDLFAGAGLASAEIGLQTTNHEALRIAGRSVNLERAATGAVMLKEAGIEVTTGIIVGLPGDTLERFENTLEWLNKTEAYSIVHPFMLSVLPGTDFRLSASSLGLIYDPMPPYHLLSSATFTQTDLTKAMELGEEAFSMEIDYMPPPVLLNSMGSGASVCERQHVSSWVICDIQNALRDLPGIIQKMTNPFTVRFNYLFDEKLVLDLIGQLILPNPHTILNIVFDLPLGNHQPSPEFLQNILQQFGDANLYANKMFFPLYERGEIIAMRIFLVAHDPKSENRRHTLIETYAGVADIIWESSSENEEILAAIPRPVLIPDQFFSENIKPVLNFLWSLDKERPEEVLFRNRNMDLIWIRDYVKRNPAHMLQDISLKS